MASAVVLDPCQEPPRKRTKDTSDVTLSILARVRIGLGTKEDETLVERSKTTPRTIRELKIMILIAADFAYCLSNAVICRSTSDLSRHTMSDSWPMAKN